MDDRPNIKAKSIKWEKNVELLSDLQLGKDS